MSPRSSLLFVMTALALAGCDHRSREQRIQDDDAKADKRESATQREQSRYRALLTTEIAWVDRRLVVMERAAAAEPDATLRATKDGDIRDARTWRVRLQQDVGLIDHPPPGVDWPSLKKDLDRDLDENRPKSMPRSFEKPYGI